MNIMPFSQSEQIYLQNNNFKLKSGYYYSVVLDKFFHHYMQLNNGKAILSITEYGKIFTSSTLLPAKSNIYRLLSMYSVSGMLDISLVEESVPL